MVSPPEPMKGPTPARGWPVNRKSICHGGESDAHPVNGVMAGIRSPPCSLRKMILLLAPLSAIVSWAAGLGDAWHAHALQVGKGDTFGDARPAGRRTRCQIARSKAQKRVLYAVAKKKWALVTWTPMLRDAFIDLHKDGGGALKEALLEAVQSSSRMYQPIWRERPQSHALYKGFVRLVTRSFASSRASTHSTPIDHR